MTNKEIEELAGHRQVPAWVVKLVADAVAIEREACIEDARTVGGDAGAEMEKLILARG